MTEPQDEEVRRRWRSRCYGMAQATYALADLCEDPEMMQGYMDLAARWVLMADDPPASLPELDPRPPRNQFPH